jgi:hypothetical protein
MSQPFSPMGPAVPQAKMPTLPSLNEIADQLTIRASEINVRLASVLRCIRSGDESAAVEPNGSSPMPLREELARAGMQLNQATLKLTELESLIGKR